MHRDHRRVLIACLAVSILPLLTASARAETGPADQVFESRYYSIHHNLPSAEVKKFGKHMDLIFAEYSRRFSGLRDRRRGRMKLYLLKTRDDYERQLALFGIDGSASGGMFFYGPRGSGLATWVGDRSERQTQQVLQHEGLHQFARNYLGYRIPVWLNEGLAEYFEQAQIIKGKVKLGIAEGWRIDRLKRAIEAGQALEFNELLNITSDRWRSNMQSGSPQGALQYTQSWSIVYFLIHGDKGRYRQAFGEYLDLLSRGRTHESAFRAAFKVRDTDNFHKRWERFVNEQLEADHYSSAIERMAFLGQGLAWLRQADLPMPATMDELRTALQERGFYVTRHTHTGEVRTDATDDALYGFEDKRGQRRAFDLAPAAIDGLPPTLSAKGLRPMPVLEWHTDEQDEVKSKMTYK